MRRLILVISGFTQDNYEATGSKKLWESLLELEDYDGHDNIIFVDLKEWDDDWKDFAKWINSINVSECFICAYSWGAGSALRKFAKRFKGAITAVLCDPVYRSIFPWMRWKALMRKQNVIKYPKNVTVKRVFYQELDEPGNDLVAGFEGKRTRLSVPHAQMDDHPAYHQAATEEIKQWLR